MPEIQIPKHYRTQFLSNVAHLLNNEGSLLRRHVTEMSVQGEKASIVDQYGVRRGRKDTERYGDTPIMSTPRDRRWVHPETYDWGDLIDNKDRLKQVLDPTSPLVQGCAWGLGENIDYDMIIPAFFGDARIGKTGENTEAFDTSGQVVGVQVQSPAAATDVGMNVKKLQTARKILRQRKVKLQREQICVAMTAQQEDDLFDDVKAIHHDYIAMMPRPLEKGMLPGLFQMTFEIIEDLETDENNHRRCPVWVKSGLVLGIDQDIDIQIAPDPGKKFNVRIYGAVTGAATRTEQGRVVEIKCKE